MTSKEGFSKEELEPTILVFNETLSLFEASPQSHLNVIDKLNKQFKKLEFSVEKQYFCLYKSYRYVCGSSYDEEKIDPELQDQFETVFKAYIDQLNEKPKNVIQSSKPIAQILKAIATDELAKLPELLALKRRKESVF